MSGIVCLLVCFVEQGMTVSVLKLPMNLASEGRTGYDVTNVTIGALASDEPFGKF